MGRSLSQVYCCTACFRALGVLAHRHARTRCRPGPPVTREDRQPRVVSQPISAAKSDAHQTWSLIDTVLPFWILLRQCFLLSVGGHHGGTGKLHSRTPDQLQDHLGKQIAAKQVSGTRTGRWNPFQSGSRGESRPVLSRQQSVFGSRENRTITEVRVVQCGQLGSTPCGERQQGIQEKSIRPAGTDDPSTRLGAVRRRAVLLRLPSDGPSVDIDLASASKPFPNSRRRQCQENLPIFFRKTDWAQFISPCLC